MSEAASFLKKIKGRFFGNRTLKPAERGPEWLRQVLITELRAVSATAKERRKLKYMLDPEGFRPEFRDQHKNDQCIDADDLYKIQKVTEAAAMLLSGRAIALAEPSHG